MPERQPVGQLQHGELKIDWPLQDAGMVIVSSCLIVLSVFLLLISIFCFLSAGASDHGIEPGFAVEAIDSVHPWQSQGISWQSDLLPAALR